MKVVVKKNYDEMSAVAADILAGEINIHPDCVLGLATGDTPVGTYRELVKKYEKGTCDFSSVRTVNLDEYYPISPDNPQSYRYFMNTNLFDKVNIKKENTHVPDGTAQNTDEFCVAYEKMIEELGGIDLQVLGIGRNGHIGFNEPADGLVAMTHLTPLTESTIDANSRFFDSVDEVPKHALTMGIKSVFSAKKIIILASGESKAEPVRRMLKGNITTDCPASLLCLHPNVTLICDEAAFSECEG